MALIIQNPDIIYSTEKVKSNDQCEYWHNIVCEQYVNLSCDTGEKTASGIIASKNFGHTNISEAHAIGQTLHRTKKHINHDIGDQFLLNIQLGGEGTFTQKGATQNLAIGDCILNDSTLPFSWDFENNFSHIILQFPRETLEKVAPKARNYSGTKIDKNSVSGKLIKSMVLSTVMEISKTDISTIEIDFLEQQVIELICSSFNFLYKDKPIQYSDHHTKTLYKLIFDFIEDNLFNKDLSIEWIAKHHNLSKRSIHKVFEHSMASVSEHIKTRRLDEAAKTLRKSYSFIQDINTLALEVGFKNTAHFCTTFKKRFGETPSNYRRGFEVGKKVTL